MKRYKVYDILKEIYTQGDTRSPRGLEIKELLYFQGEIANPWSNYRKRNYPLDYFKAEMQWYLGANPKDTRIFKHAKMWKKLTQSDGSILSNYGQYWFGWQNGFKWVIDTLTSDPDSRQAYIAMNNYHHAYPGNPDFVCTKGVKFDIVEGCLNIHVSMRSSDAIFGLATDLPCFWTLWEMVATELGYPIGEFIFSADSVHIYERHYDLVRDIIDDGPHAVTLLSVPEVTDSEDLISSRFESPFGRWLAKVEL